MNIATAPGSGAVAIKVWLAFRLAPYSDQLVGRVALGDEARFHPKVDRLGMMGNDRHCRLLGQDGVGAGEGHADLFEVEKAPDLLVLGLVRAGGVAPGVAAALVEGDAELAAHFGVQPLGQALGCLDTEAVDEELL